MNYQLTLKKIISNQYLFTGLRITAAAIIPAIFLYHYNVLGLMTAIPLGAVGDVVIVISYAKNGF